MNWHRRGLGPSLAIFASQIAIVASAHAQQGAGVLTGKVLDASSKAPVADVVVTVTSPALQGEELVVTDTSGSYRLPNLPPGAYTVRFEKETYRPYSRPGVNLRADTTIRLDADILPESLKSEEVVVVGRAPTVDVGSTTSGINITADLVRRVPVSRPGGKGSANRSFESVAEMAPGAKSDTYGTSISGSTSPENQYVIDGLSVNNPANGLGGAPLSVEFIKEVNVISGGYMPEYGRATGGVLNVVTKSGSNEFHGSFWGNVTPGALEAPRTPVKSDGSTVRTRRELGMLGDLGFDIGGPIKKDKLWFYAGFQVARTSFKLTRTLNRLATGPDGKAVKDADGFALAETIPGTEQKYLAQSTGYNIIGKLTYTYNNQNRFTLSSTATPSYSGGNGTYPMDPETGAVGVGNLVGPYSALSSKLASSSFNNTLKWTTESTDKKVLLDTTIGWTHQEGYTLPGDGTRLGSGQGYSAMPSVTWRRTPGFHSITDFESFANSSYCDPTGQATALRCPLTGYTTGGTGFIDESNLNRYQLRSILTFLAEGAGHHVIKGGIDFELMQFDHLRGYTGQRALRESTDGASFTETRQYGYLTGPDQAVILDSLRWKTNGLTMGGFLQDSWSVFDKVTVNFGMRYDAQFIFGGDGKVALSLPNQISPRVGVIFDPTQSGRSKIYANFARFYENVPLGLADRAGSGEPQVSSDYNSNGAGCNFKNSGQAAGACVADTNRVVQGGPTSPDKKWVVTGAGATPIDPNVSPQSSDELLFGGEYDIIKDARIGISYQKRWLNTVLEDMSRDEAQTYFIGNPGHGIAKDFPEVIRRYDAGTIYIQKIFSDNWLAQLNYTLSSLRGNYAGLFRPETGQLNPNISSDFDLISLLPNRFGPLPGDSTHEIKMFGAYNLPISQRQHLNLGGSFRARSGGPTNYLGSHPLYGADEVYVLPRGSGDRLPWIFNIDTNLAYELTLAKDRSVTISMDIFNLFNFQQNTSIDERYTSSDVLPIVNGTKDQLGELRRTNGTDFNANLKNPNFLNPNAYQTPRQFRFGIRTTF